MCYTSIDNGVLIMVKILIVEDEVAIADLEKDYLELSGFDVEVANDGLIGLQKSLEEALVLIQEQKLYYC